MSTSLTTATTTLFDARTTAEGGPGDSTNLAGLKIGRINSYYITNDSGSASAVSVLINGQTLPREVAPGVTLAFARQGKIQLVTASAVSTATVYTGVLGE